MLSIKAGCGLFSKKGRAWQGKEGHPRVVVIYCVVAGEAATYGEGEHGKEQILHVAIICGVAGGEAGTVRRCAHT
jgi:hypothetical protein